MNQGNFIIDAFIDEFCRFEKLTFGDDSDDWLFETEIFLLLGLTKWVSFQGVYAPQVDLIERFMERCVAKGLKKIHRDKNAKVLNYCGSVVFGFKFNPNIYNLISHKDKLNGHKQVDKTEMDTYTDNFIDRHLVYRSKSVEKCEPIFELYRNVLGKAHIMPHRFDDFLVRTVHLIPQVKLSGNGKCGELLNVLFTVSGLNNNKIQRILNTERAAINFKIPAGHM